MTKLAMIFMKILKRVTSGLAVILMKIMNFYPPGKGIQRAPEMVMVNLNQSIISSGDANYDDDNDDHHHKIVRIDLS